MIIGFTNTDAIQVSIAPIFGTLGNGTVTVTATATPHIIGGFAPYSYAWSDDNVNVTINDAASVTTRLQSTGTNVERTGTLVLIVTQANGATTTASANFNLTHGTP
jgi:hypothetical protein